jgi:hypothetical protein
MCPTVVSNQNVDVMLPATVAAKLELGRLRIFSRFIVTNYRRPTAHHQTLRTTFSSPSHTHVKLTTMKFLFGLFLAVSPFFAFAQSDTQFISLEGATAVYIYAAFSSVTVTTGGTDAIKVDHTVTVDGADRPGLRRLAVERIDGVLHLREVKPTAELLQAEFSQPNGGMNTGGRNGGKGVFNNLTVDAVLKVVVPVGIPVTVETKYGGIEAVNVANLLSARARYGEVKVTFTRVKPQAELELYSDYGAVDVTIPVSWGTNLDLTTEYGELFTNMAIDIDGEQSEEKAFYHRVIGAVGGGGKMIKCTALYGDVYLREG